MAVADSRVGAVTCPVTTLAAGASTTCTATAYVITQADVDAGAVTNTATATGRSPLNAPVTSDPSSTATPTSTVSALQLVKSADTPVDDNGNLRIDAGDRITYHFAVTNRGSTTIRALTVTDPTIIGAVSCPVTTLAPAATTTCTATYTITQADADAVAVTNTASVSGTTTNGAAVTSPSSSTTTITSIVASLQLTKTAAAPVDANASGRLDAGDSVDYTVVATNTGAVTLTNAYVLDPQLPDCPHETLTPGQSTTCTGTYALTQTDLDRGFHENTARAFGTTPSEETLASNPASTTTNLTPVSSLSFTKRAGTPGDVNGNDQVDAGDRIDYTFTVANTGTVSVINLAVVDPLVAAVTCPITTLAPGASTVCTGSYVLTQADADAGGVTNTARATGTDPTGRPVRSPDSSTSTPVPTRTALALVKSADRPVDLNTDGRTDAGDRIDYTFAVTNIGTTTVDDLVIVDALVGDVTCPVRSVAPAATATCTAAYVVTQADVDAGAVDNTATAAGTDPRGFGLTSPPSSTTTPTSPATALTLTKTAALPTDVDGNGRVNAGDTIDYAFAVTNAGAVTLSALTILDSRVTATCPVATLAPAAATSCTATYTITQADVDAGVVDNTATATARTPAGTAVTSPASSTTTATDTRSRVELDKQAGTPEDVNASGRTDAGDRIDYRFVVTNTGDVTLTDVGIADDLIAGTASCPSTTLLPGDATTCTATYLVTQADVDAGTVANTATASGLGPDDVTTTSGPDSTATPTSVSAALALLKTAGTPVDVDDSGAVDAGDTIAYTFALTNTGAVTLTGPAVTDPLITAPVDCPATALAPGQTATCAATYAITQADVDAGVVRNTATANATDAGGNAVGSAESSTTTPITTTASVTFDKTAAAPVDANASGRIDAGDTIAYSFAVTNTGVLTLDDLTILDGLVTADCPSTVLAPGATATCTGSHVITQAEVDAGTVDNTATATVRRPNGTTLVSAPDTTTTPIGATSTLSLVKTAAAPTDVNDNGRTDVGDTIAYRFRVTNTGTATIRAVAVTDPKAGPVSCPVTTLAPAASVECTATYAVSQADVDAASVVNTAYATASGPGDTPLTSPDSSTTTPTSGAAAVAVVKTPDSPADVNENGRVDAGDTIGYRFAVTNTGATTLTALAIADAQLSTGVSCPTTTLAPAETTTCTGTYAITQADVDAGSITNTATAAGTDPFGTRVESDPSSTTTTTSTAAALTVDKEAGTPVDVDDNGLVDTGDTIAYTFTVTNPGARTVTSLTVVDSLVDAPCATTVLAPNDATVCTGTYTITQDDVDAGVVENTATVTGQRPDGGTVTSPPDSTTTPIQGDQALALDKTAGTPVDRGDNGLVDAGDTIDYTFDVTNIGDVTVADLTINDAQLPTGITCPATTVEVGETVTCTGTYAITQADVDAGSVRNTATAAGTAPDDLAVGSPPDTTETPTSSVAELTVDKTAGTPNDVNLNGTTDAGDTLDYTFAVSNTGTVTLADVRVLDSRLATAAVCVATSLAPATATTCTATYVITQTDVDAGSVDNTARAAADDPQGRALRSGGDATSTPTSGTAELTLTKTAGTPVDANRNGLVDTGDTIAYTFAVTNTGGVSVTSLAIADAMITTGTSCPTRTLAPGASTVCTATYAIQQSDVNAGVVANTATATGTAPNGEPVESAPSSTSTPTASTATITLDKRASTPVDVDANGQIDAGDTIAYTFLVANTGVQTVTAVEITDSRLTVAPSCDVALVAPGASATCTASYTLIQADVDAGAVTNTATAAATDPAGDAVTARPDSTTTPTSTAAALAFDKTAGVPTDTGGNGRVDAGDTIAYRFDVSNTGSRTVSALAVTDPKITTPIACATTTLAPEATTTCDATYTITQADVDAGAVTNTASVAGVDPDGAAVVSAPDSTTTPTSTATRVDLDKTAAAPFDANGDGRVDAGDTITFTFAVTNGGATTLRGVTVNDPLVGAVSCPTGDLAPDAVASCTATYAITQADVNAGAFSNTATASARTPNGTELTSAPDSTNTPTSGIAALSLDKTAGTPSDVNANGRVDAGDTIAYTFVVTNTGDVTASDVSVRDLLVGPVDCGVLTTLEPDDQASCAATYAITQADVDRGSVDNSATAAGTSPSGAAIVSDPDSTSTTTDDTSTLTLTKTAGAPSDTNSNGQVDAGDTIPYAFVVTNTGSVTIDAIAITDPLLVDDPVCDTPSLRPGARANCTATYPISQADVDSDSVVNSATAIGTDPAGDPVASAPASVTVITSDVSSLTLDKQAGAPIDADDDGRVDTIEYSFTVTNTGAVTLSDLVIGDSLVDATCPTTTLAPGQARTCTAAYAITQDDIDAGSVENTATATAREPGGEPVSSTPDSTTTALAREASLTLEKTAGVPVDANGNGRVDTGDTIAYTFTLTNTGGVTLTDLVVSDAKVGVVSCPVTSLPVGGQAVCAAAYAITQADVDAGSVDNTATASGAGANGVRVTSPADSTQTPTSSVATLLLDKSAGVPVDANDSGRVDAGDTLDYAFAVTNTGAVTITGVTVVDALVTATCPTTTLLPGRSTTCTGIHTITQAEIDAGSIVNSATATGARPGDAAVTSNVDTTTTPLATASGLRLVKTAGTPVDVNDNGRADTGDTIAFTFAVTNTGALSVSGIAVSDPLVGAVTCPTGPVAPGATVTCTATYAITQADVDTGQFVNTATASGTDANGEPVGAPGSQTRTPLDRSADLQLAVSAGTPADVNGNGRVDVGDTVVFTYRVTNTGAVTVDGITISGSNIPSGTTCTPAVVAPGAQSLCTGTYAITQADVDAGRVVTTGVANGSDPTGDPVVSDPDSAEVPIGGVAAVRLVKTAVAPAAGAARAGDLVPYTFVVTNTGSVSLTGLTVTDPLLAGVSCPATSLAPGVTVTCTADYRLTQADIDAGSVTNTATATATPAGRAPITAPSSVTTVTTGTGGFSLDKRAGTPVDANDDGQLGAGDTIAYTFAIANTGTVAIRGLTVTDRQVGPVTCPDVTLAPDATSTCTAAAYVITQADVDAGRVVNTATANGTDAYGNALPSVRDTVTTPLLGTSTLLLTKAGVPTDTNRDGSIGSGDTIDYTFAVTNTGTTTLTGVGIRDPRINGAIPCALTTLVPGAETTCTASYTITAADARVGAVDNTATSTGTDPAGATVTSNGSSTSTPLGTAVSLGLVKRAGTPVDVNGNGLVDAGDTIAYTFTVTNTGEQPVTAVAVTDEPAGAVTCPTTTLAADTSTECLATTPYVITKDDLDAGAVVNTATASATGPAGAVISDPATVRTVVGTVGMTLAKTAGPVQDVNDSGTTDAGDRVRFRFLVTNTGSLTLTDVAVIDPMLVDAGVAVVCPTTTLEPGESTTCESGDYTITADDEQAGQVRNIATAEGTTFAGRSAGSPADSVTVPVAEPSPSPSPSPSNGPTSNPPTTEPTSGPTTGPGVGNGDGDGDSLPNTGSPVAPWLPALGLFLMLAGGLTLGLRKRLGTKMKE